MSWQRFAVNWTAPRDDCNTGTATEYDVRYSTSQIYDETTFLNATQVAGEPTPSVASTGECVEINNLTCNTLYCVAMRTRDKAGYWSPISNVASATTQSCQSQQEATCGGRK